MNPRAVPVGVRFLANLPQPTFCTGSDLPLPCLRWSFQDGHVEVGPHGHRRAVLVEYRPLTTVAVVPNADRVVVVLAGAATRVPIVRNHEDGVGVAVGRGLWR